MLKACRELLDYCRANMAHAEKEALHVLFLDRQNVLIADEVQQTGTIDHTPVYPREVIKRALDHGASAIVLAHNHPSGDSTPSQSDIEMTHEVRDAGEKLGITLHDHLVIGKRGPRKLQEAGAPVTAFHFGRRAIGRQCRNPLPSDVSVFTISSIARITRIPTAFPSRSPASSHRH